MIEDERSYLINRCPPGDPYAENRQKRSVVALLSINKLQLRTKPPKLSGEKPLIELSVKKIAAPLLGQTH